MAPLLMHRIVKHITRAVILPFFLVYALSPLCLSTADDGSGGSSLAPYESKVTVGILWLTCLIDTIVTDGDADAAGGLASMRSGHDDDLVLVKKKRVLGRKNYSCEPVFEVSLAERDGDHQTIPHAASFDIPRDLIHSHSDGYRSLNTGLSPPLQLS